ncbi:hypothetical protein AGR6A_pTi0183 [Agrobacterium sp. NCPPB 925]|nr:hypothetical protein AGR6A_pTi0183 [Agrobacterium sp. NCPPB 925]
MKQVVQEPYRSGTSAQGGPVRKRHKMTLTTRVNARHATRLIWEQRMNNSPFEVGDIKAETGYQWPPSQASMNQNQTDLQT